MATPTRKILVESGTELFSLLECLGKLRGTHFLSSAKGRRAQADGRSPNQLKARERPAAAFPGEAAFCISVAATTSPTDLRF